MRPIVIIHSDDWGRTGVPDVAALSAVRDVGFPVGDNPWDFYGLESSDDLRELSKVLEHARDKEGQPACIVTNFILANPDLRRMRHIGWKKTHWIELNNGLPPPWDEPGLLEAYNNLIKAGVFWPALHGYSHFNERVWINALGQQETELGRRVRVLVEHDIPYLASLTPELNFALVDRHGNNEIPRSMQEQSLWLENGIRAYRDMFGRHPISTCAPGYRSNKVTDRLWQAAGIKVVQSAERCLPYYRGDMLTLPRNVFFEPTLENSNVVSMALESAKAAAAAGLPIIICSHSINYMERHLKRAAHGRTALSNLLDMLLSHFPNLRFAHDAIVYDTYTQKNPEWWRKPTRAEVEARRKHGFC